jgi:hypothetical protein
MPNLSQIDLRRRRPVQSVRHVPGPHSGALTQFFSHSIESKHVKQLRSIETKDLRSQGRNKKRRFPTTHQLSSAAKAAPAQQKNIPCQTKHCLFGCETVETQLSHKESAM